MTADPTHYNFLPGNGEMSSLIARHDWANTPLGPLEAWPPHLRAIVSMILGSPLPMVILWGQEGIMIYNDAYAEVAAHKHPHLCGMPVRDAWPEVADFNEQSLREGLAGRSLTFRNYEMTLQRKGNPERIWFNLDYSPVYDEQGVPVGVIAILNEITERVIAERGLNDEREKLLQMFSQAPGMMSLLKGPEHRFDLANAAYLRWIGDRDIIGKPLGEALPEVVDQGFIEILDQVYATGETYVAAAGKVKLARRPDQPLEEFFVDFVFQPLTDSQGRVTGIFIEGFNVTEREHTARALRQSERQFQTLVNTIPQLAWMTESGGSIYWFNQRWYDYTGATPEQMQNQGWMDILHPDHRAETVEILAAKKEWERHFQLRAADGSYHWFLTHGIPIFDENGELKRWFGTNTDITEMKRLQEDLRVAAEQLADADHRKDEFIATLAHELRNPLAPILSGLEVMKKAGPQPPLMDEIRRIMERQTQQLVSLVDDLLDISRLKLSKLELRKSWVDLADIVDVAVDTSRPLIDSAGHTLSIAIDPSIRLHIDPHRIAQVLTNLLNNAAKYTPDGGEIIVRTCRQDEGVSIVIRDSGVGISPESQHRIFELFSQLDRPLEKGYKGLGVGLTLAKTLVEMHNGRIEVFSKGENAGSEFRIWLPVGVAEPDADAPPLSEAPSTSYRMLVVDDNTAAVETLSLLMKLIGHEVATACDGLDAIDKAETFSPQVILMDIGMPGMNGYEATQHIRTQPWGQDVLIIALTGWGQQEDRRRTQEAGFDYHLVKPLELAELQKILAKESLRLTVGQA